MLNGLYHIYVGPDAGAFSSPAGPIFQKIPQIALTAAPPPQSSLRCRPLPTPVPPPQPGKLDPSGREVDLAGVASYGNTEERCGRLSIRGAASTL